jgi:acetyltransferase-like isoleucine patch superfamily enzyme
MEPISERSVVIEDNVLIGANATVLAGIHIGKNAIVGAGSVVTKDVLDNTVVAGIPAKVINSNGEWKLNKDLR